MDRPKATGAPSRSSGLPETLRTDADRMDSTFTLEFTTAQQDGYRQLAGSRKTELTLPHRKLGALVLAAAAAGRDMLPVSSSPAMIHCMLHPESLPDDVSKPFVVCIPLTAEQSDQIRQLTGKHIRVVAIAPEEWPVSYGEPWDIQGPIRIGRSITVHVQGVGDVVANGDHLVELPRSAEGVFGSGLHPATSLAMLLIEDHLTAGASLFDIGTGSGILAIAAARLGAGEILAVDVDADAVAVAREAVTLNGFAGQITVESGSIEVGQSQYDMVVMNIFPPVILSLAPDLTRVLRPQGLLVTSGTTVARAHGLIKGMARYGYRPIAEQVDANWIAHLFREDA